MTNGSAGNGRESLAAHPEALILVIAANGTAGDQAEEFARRWQASVPGAAFVPIEVELTGTRADAARLARLASDAASSRSLRPSQAVLLGTGGGARLAMDLLIQNLVAGVGVLGFDIPLWPLPSPLPPTAAMVRLIQHKNRPDGESSQYLAFAEALQREGVDVRSMILPPRGEISREATFRAGAAYLAELVAAASRLPPTPRSAS
jgi:hypothetical protein